jgi:hypothetical protein
MALNMPPLSGPGYHNVKFKKCPDYYSITGMTLAKKLSDVTCLRLFMFLPW